MRPSSLERRHLCPGSYRQEQGKPQEETVYNREGTELHALVAQAIQGNEVDAGEHQDAVNNCVSVFNQLHGNRGPVVLIEEPLEIGPHIPGMVDTGTPDLLMVRPFLSAVVVDWKFTHIDPPPADQNLQLAAYAVAAALKYQCTRAEAHIVLAYTNRMTSMVLDSRAAIMECRDRLAEIVRYSLNPLAPLLPSERACRYCRAKVECPAMLEAVSKLGELTDEGVQQMSAAEIALLLPTAAVVNKWAGAVKHRAVSMAIAGAEIPGYELRDGKRNRKWHDGTGIEHLQDVLGESADPESLFTPLKLRSPAQIEKLFGGKAEIKKALEPLIKTSRAAPQLKEKKND